jgi:hypothetical protein
LYTPLVNAVRALARECLERWCGRTSDNNEDNFQTESCQPTALVLPIAKNEKFGTSSLYGQHTGKLSDLPLGAAYSVRERRASRVERQSCSKFWEFST